jgi:uncharacterized membrane protein
MIQGTQMTINIYGGIICYMFLVLGMYYFIIMPKKSIMDAFLLVIVIYGVYEFTNLALFKKWSLYTCFIDTIWGGILFSYGKG